MGDKGRSSLEVLPNSRSPLMVKVVGAVDSFETTLPFEGDIWSCFFFSFGFWSLGLRRPDCLLLPEEESCCRSSSDSSCGLGFAGSARPLGGGWSKIMYSSSIYLASFLHPLQQSRQSHTKNLKQNASIFIQGWKQMHRFLKSILFLSE